MNPQIVIDLVNAMAKKELATVRANAKASIDVARAKAKAAERKEDKEWYENQVRLSEAWLSSMEQKIIDNAKETIERFK